MVMDATWIDPDEVRARARRVRLMITDCDGVLTDAGVYYGPRGEELKRFSIRDGMGVERLRNAGVETAIVSGETSEPLRARARKLGIELLFEGVRDKSAALSVVLERARVRVDEVAYIGDDINDLGLVELVRDHGLTATPWDGFVALRRSVHHVCRAAGGHGAFREFAEWLLTAREGGHVRTEGRSE